LPQRIRKIYLRIPYLEHDLPSVGVVAKRGIRLLKLVEPEFLAEAKSVCGMVTVNTASVLRQSRIPMVDERRVIASAQYPHYFSDGKSGIDGWAA
jgi:hypothetical protein